MQKIYFMKNFKFLIISIFILTIQNVFAQGTDANLIGHVVSGGKHIPYANVSLVGTTIGTTTDHTGHFQIINIPEGSYIVHVTSLGFQTKKEGGAGLLFR